MDLLAADWVTISSLATAGGTLVLAIATFAAVRSSNRAARIAETALQEQRRPVLSSSRLDDHTQKIMFFERNWVSAEGGRAAVVNDDGIVYLAMSLRNVGEGTAVCHGWTAWAGYGTYANFPAHAPVETFRSQTRDLYIPAGDIGMWQGALRHPDDQTRAAIADAVDAKEPLTVELLYTDLAGGQRTISRFGLIPVDDEWLVSLNRHWYLDSRGPRPEDIKLAAAESIIQDHEAHEARHHPEPAQHHPAPTEADA